MSQFNYFDGLRPDNLVESGTPQSRNSALLEQLERARKETGQMLEQRGNRDRLVDMLESVLLGRATGIPLEELMGTLKRSDLEAQGIVESPASRQERRLNERREIKARQMERATKARADFKARRKKLRDSRLGKQAFRKKVRGKSAPRGQASPDMTPIDVAAENRMLMEDMLDFGPTPGTGDPRTARPEITRALNRAEEGVLRESLEAQRNRRGMPEIIERYDPEFVGARRPEDARFRELTGLDRPTRLTDPVSMTAEDAMMMRDLMDFGPTPAASGPVGEPRQFPAAPGDGPTPSQQLSQRMTTREEAERGMSRVAGGAAGSAPAFPVQTTPQRGGYAYEPDPAGGTKFVRTEAAKEAERYARGETSGGPNDMPYPVGSDPIDIDELESSLKQEVDELKKQDRITKLIDQREALRKQHGLSSTAMFQGARGKADAMRTNLQSGQQRGGPVSTGMPAAFDRNVRQPLRNMFGMNQGR
tara:strand:- start:1467 stop:2897 length:1431 start_codon:yes stop_codon:yes gene_type:complete